MHYFISLIPNMEQLICELMPGNLDRIIIRRAGCLILSTVFTKDLMLSALVTYSNSNESFICFFKGFHPGSVFWGTNGSEICFSSILGKLVFHIII